jgi:hypothetical protein
MNSLLLTKLRFWRCLMIAFLPLAVAGLAQEEAKARPTKREPVAIAADQFVRLHTLIKPQPGARPNMNLADHYLGLTRR